MICGAGVKAATLDLGSSARELTSANLVLRTIRLDLKNLYESNSSLSDVAENCEVWRAELVKQSGG